MPADVERPVGGEEVERRVWQMLMNPSSQNPPITWLLMLCPETGNDNADHCSHVAMGVKAIPDVPGVVALVGRAGVAGLLL
ncbi:MAG: hypothetical protein RLZZ444_4161, partial [Pseudomonadota bacterium]